MKVSALIGVVCGVLLVSSGVVFWYFCPIFYSPPSLVGPYGVGVFYTSIIDNDRSEPHVRDLSQKRTLPLVMYYPSARESIAENTSVTRYTTAYNVEFCKALRQYVYERTGVPRFLLTGLVQPVISRAHQGVPCASDQQLYPVVIFSHGIGGINGYSTYLEDIASHGYIVVAVSHLYDVAFTLMPDGSVIKIDPTLQAIMDKIDRPAIYEYRRKAHHLWLEDLRCVITRLQHLNQLEQFPTFQKLNLNKIGVLGHSHGGDVAMALCAADDRCNVGINMDGWTKSVDHQLIHKPFLFLVNEYDMPEIDQFCAGDVRKVIVPGALHGAFSDGVLLKWPLSRLLGETTQDGFIVRKAILEEICSFLGTYL